MIDKSIFRAYDIRGVYPTELDEDGAYKIARALVEYIHPPKSSSRARRKIVGAKCSSGCLFGGWRMRDVR